MSVIQHRALHHGSVLDTAEQVAPGYIRRYGVIHIKCSLYCCHCIANWYVHNVVNGHLIVMCSHNMRRVPINSNIIASGAYQF